MKKVLGIGALLLAICVFTAWNNPNFLSAYNMQNTIRWISLFSLLGIGVSFVIISGGIDLSIGSVVGLVGTLLGWMLATKGVSVPVALAICVGVSLSIGLLHGLLITKMKLQPFVVTLCGLLFYRGVARLITDDQSIGFGAEFEGLRRIENASIPLGGGFALPMPAVYLIVIGILAAIILNRTVFGRYLLALGRNETAARYSGIRTDRVVIAAYVWCSLLAGFGGILFALNFNSLQPQGTGEFYELYAIAAAVLGGCSLRGGEGSILGVILGTAVIRVLFNAINILQIPSTLEFAIIGVVLLAGVMTDEIVKRVVARRKAVLRT
jgi:ribose transport system permease protein